MKWGVGFVVAAIAAASFQPAEAQNPPPPCNACACVYIMGYLFGCYCDRELGGNFQECWSSGGDCWGTPCGWAEDDLQPLLVAAQSNDLRMVRRLVHSKKGLLTFSVLQRAVLVRDCRGRVLGQVALFGPARGRLVAVPQPRARPTVQWSLFEPRVAD